MGKEIGGQTMWTTILEGESCKWCGRNLARSFLRSMISGVEKANTILYPVLCICGGITVIGAGTFVSHFDDLNEDMDRQK